MYTTQWELDHSILRSLYLEEERKKEEKEKNQRNQK